MLADIRARCVPGEEFPDRDAAGFHIPGAFDKVLDIKKCHLQDDLGNRLRLFVKKYCKDNNLPFYDLRAQHGFMRTLMIRIASTGEVMVVAVVGSDDVERTEAMLNALNAEFPEITSLHYVINLKVNDSIADQNVITIFRQTLYRRRNGGVEIPRRTEIILSDKLASGIRTLQGGA